VSFSGDETRITDSLQKLLTVKVRKNGRRSACTKLKRTFEEEKDGLMSFLDWFVCLMVFNATFNNMSVLLVEKTTDLSEVTDKLDHIMLYTWL
jgi:hypothetical protein